MTELHHNSGISTAPEDQSRMSPSVPASHFCTLGFYPGRFLQQIFKLQSVLFLALSLLMIILDQCNGCPPWPNLLCENFHNSDGAWPNLLCENFHK